MDNSVLQRLLEEGTIDQQTFDKYATSNKLNDQDASEAKQDSTNDQSSTDGFKLSTALLVSLATKRRSWKSN